MFCRRQASAQPPRRPTIVAADPHRKALTPAAQRIPAGTRNFHYLANRDAGSPPGVPDADNLHLIRYDFVKYATGAERKRLLEKWERDVHAQPR